jgi:anti-sigma factor (TIGR02949 family)
MEMKEKFVCADAFDEIEAYLDGDLTADAAAALERHLDSCPQCTEELAWARRVRRELRALPPLACPPEVTERVMAEVHSDGEAAGTVTPFRRPGSPATSRWPLRFAAAAAVLLAILTGTVLLRPITPETQYTAAELAQAEEDARLALAVLSAIQRRAGDKIRQDVLVKRVVEPPQAALSRIVTLPHPASEETL